MARVTVIVKYDDEDFIGEIQGDYFTSDDSTIDAIPVDTAKLSHSLATDFINLYLRRA